MRRTESLQNTLLSAFTLQLANADLTSGLIAKTVDGRFLDGRYDRKILYLQGHCANLSDNAKRRVPQYLLKVPHSTAWLLGSHGLSRRIYLSNVRR